jgi:hypothetical protein
MNLENQVIARERSDRGNPDRNGIASPRQLAGTRNDNISIFLIYKK